MPPADSAGFARKFLKCRTPVSYAISSHNEQCRCHAADFIRLIAEARSAAANTVEPQLGYRCVYWSLAAAVYLRYTTLFDFIYGRWLKRPTAEASFALDSDLLPSDARRSRYFYASRYAEEMA